MSEFRFIAETIKSALIEDCLGLALLVALLCALRFIAANFWKG